MLAYIKGKDTHTNYDIKFKFIAVLCFSFKSI